MPPCKHTVCLCEDLGVRLEEAPEHRNHVCWLRVGGDVQGGAQPCLGKLNIRLLKELHAVGGRGQNVGVWMCLTGLRRKSGEHTRTADRDADWPIAGLRGASAWRRNEKDGPSRRVPPTPPNNFAAAATPPCNLRKYTIADRC